MSSEDTAHIPIDIHLGQILEWLVSRRHCTKDWHMNLQKIREKLSVWYPHVLENESLKKSIEELDLPLTASTLLFTHCKKLSDFLGGTELGSKNLLGQYQSAVMKDLAEILRLYEKDNTYLAELGQVIYRNIVYDIPFLKKQMQKLDQTSAEYAKKSENCVRNAGEFRDQYLKECLAVGIKGQNVRDELLESAKILPELYENIVRQSGVLIPVCTNVEDFIRTVHKGDSIKDQSGPTFFPLLRHIMKHGNVPYPYEEKAQKENIFANVEVMETAPRTAPEEDSESSQTSLDVNLNDTIADHLSELNRSSVHESIDFDLADESGDGNVDWDIGTDESCIVIEESGDSAFRNVLDNPELRTQIMNELYELSAFLQRRAEEQSTDHRASELLNIHVGDSRLVNDTKMVQQSIDNVRQILDLFNDHRLQSLCKLHDSATYLERLTKKLDQKLLFAIRMEDRADSYKIHRLEALEERNRLGPELAKLIDNTKSIQKFVEEDISDKYKGRRVNVLGGVQAVI